MLILLFLPLVLALECPEDFKLFKRVPTARNNHTKEYCLGLFYFQDLNIREHARSYCTKLGASLAMPENEKEYNATLSFPGARNTTWSRAHAIDGEVSPHCRAKMYREEITWMHNWVQETGECNIKKHLLIFDDRNTDPTWILSQYKYTSLNHNGYYAVEGHSDKRIYHLGGCLMLNHNGELSLEYCNGGVEASEGKMDHQYKSVLCGVHPE